MFTNIFNIMLFLKLTHWQSLVTLAESELLPHHTKIESVGHSLLIIHC